jgi:hypothetical protein
LYTIQRPGVKRAGFSLILGLLMCGAAGAADFGLVLSPAGEYVSDAGGEGFGFTGTLRPWFSAALGEKTSLYLSGKISFDYEYDHQDWARPPLFELERTEVNFRPAPAVYLSLGRRSYQDSGGMIAAGLFDGVSGSVSFGRASISLGALYTGFLYKEAAEIQMTAEDRDRYIRPLNYGEPETYFASRRALLPLDLNFSDLASRLSLAFTLLAQIDVNDAPALHTQYLAARFNLDAMDSLRFTLTGIGALAEDGGAKARAHFAGAFGTDWDLPGALTDMVQAELRWGGGAAGGDIVPFTPVTSIAQGTVFTPSLRGLMNLRAAYSARFSRDTSFTGEAVFFWRTDVETFQDRDLNGASKDRYLGTEARGAVIWNIRSALRLSAGGGAFFPGGAFIPDAGIRWKINGGIILSL